MLVALEDGETATHGAAFMAAKVATAQFYGDHILTQAPGLALRVLLGGDAVMALAQEAF